MLMRSTTPIMSHESYDKEMNCNDDVIENIDDSRRQRENKREEGIRKYPKHENCIEFNPIQNVKNYRWLKSTSVKPNMWGEGLCTLFLQKRKIPFSLGARARRPVRVLKGRQGSGGRLARTKPRSCFWVLILKVSRKLWCPQSVISEAKLQNFGIATKLTL